jgi:hypothetical protein
MNCIRCLIQFSPRGSKQAIRAESPRPAQTRAARPSSTYTALHLERPRLGPNRRTGSTSPSSPPPAAGEGKWTSVQAEWGVRGGAAPLPARGRRLPLPLRLRPRHPPATRQVRTHPPPSRLLISSAASMLRLVRRDQAWFVASPDARHKLDELCWLERGILGGRACQLLGRLL